MKRKTKRELHREYVERINDARMARLTSEPLLDPFLPEVSGELPIPGLRPGDLRVLRFVHDGDDFVADVGAVLGHGFSELPVLAIYRGDPYTIWTADRNPALRLPILVGPRAIRAEIAFRRAVGPDG